MMSITRQLDSGHVDNGDVTCITVALKADICGYPFYYAMEQKRCSGSPK